MNVNNMSLTDEPKYSPVTEVYKTIMSVKNNLWNLKPFHFFLQFKVPSATSAIITNGKINKKQYVVLVFPSKMAVIGLMYLIYGLD